MIIEAQQKGLARGSNPAEKLARSPDVVRKLRAYEEWTLAIPRMGIEVEEVTFQDLVASMTMRQKMGLLTLDAMLVAVMARLRISCLASADQAFSRIGEVTLFSPGDVTV
jgi:predicted nucleic acid-binding protein